MRVIAASFADLDAARGTLRRLTSEAGVRVDDADVAPHADGFVLGLRLTADTRAAVRRIVEESGGRVVMDVPESWTRGSGYDPATPDHEAAPAADAHASPAIRVHGAPA